MLLRDDLVFPELSYKLTGILFDVSNQLGGGHLERYYQKAIAIALKKENIKFQEQFYIPVKFNNQIIGKYFLDFVIEDKIIIELKRGKFIPAVVIKQIKQYLETLHLQLALIACFTYTGVSIKRILNTN